MSYKSSRYRAQHWRQRMDGMLASINYNQKVLRTGPIAYWPQYETSGLVAHCLVNPAQNGTYTGVTLANDATGPFGMPAPFYDGASGYLDVNTAALQALLNAGGAECTLAIWAKVNAAGVWADGVWRVVAQFYDSLADRFSISKSNAVNTLYDYWLGGGALEDYTDNVADTDWMHLTITRSEAADEVKYYRDAVLLATDTGLSGWASAGVWSHMLIGADSAVPTQPWHGWLGPAGLWGRALTQPTITELALV